MIKKVEIHETWGGFHPCLTINKIFIGGPIAEFRKISAIWRPLIYPNWIAKATGGAKGMCLEFEYQNLQDLFEWVSTCSVNVQFPDHQDTFATSVPSGGTSRLLRSTSHQKGRRVRSEITPEKI